VEVEIDVEEEVEVEIDVEEEVEVEDNMEVEEELNVEEVDNMEEELNVEEVDNMEEELNVKEDKMEVEVDNSFYKIPQYLICLNVFHVDVIITQINDLARLRRI
jgi:hypothetical protein